MDNILKLKHHSKSFFTITILIMILIVAIRFYIIPHYDENLVITMNKLVTSILDNLFTSFVTTIFIGAFIYWLTPKIMEKSIMKVIEPKEISPLLQSSAKTSRSWIFKGAAGRYTRAVTLPLMAEAARHEGLGRDIKIFLINPNNEHICNEYSIYRKSLKSGKKDKWDLEKVITDVIATIVYTMIIKHKEPLLRIEIYLLDNFSTFRYDISDEYAVITKEDKQVSALKADAGTYYYSSYIDELRLNERQGKKVNINNNVEKIRDIDNNIDIHHLKKFIKKLNIIDKKKIDKIDFKKIKNSLDNLKNPYSN